MTPIAQEKLSEVYQILQQAIDDRAFPGAVIFIAMGGTVISHQAFGNMDYSATPTKMERDTIFDLASLTKVVATTTATMILYEEGKIDLDQYVGYYIPEFAQERKSSVNSVRYDGSDRVKVKHLLTHSSGLPDWRSLYRSCDSKESIPKAICDMDLDFEPGTKTVYSDLGTIVLGQIIEEVSGYPLDKYCQNRIFGPLKMKDTMFNPLHTDRFMNSTPTRKPWERIAPTEDCRWRGRVLRGEVHDENAFAMGGVAPHAGLFSTAPDLSVFLQMLLDRGEYKDQRFLKESTVELFTKRQDVVQGANWGLGWKLWSEGCLAGKLFSRLSYGHTGFTGTSIWTDPERELFVILLTNRVHPTRENRGILEVRPKVHDAVIRSLGAHGSMQNGSRVF